jgi:hypothetical protein
VLAAVLGALPGRAVEVWSSAQAAGDEHDEVVAALAVEQLPDHDRRRVRLVRDHVDAHELLARTAASSAVVSMRFHPALLAAGQGTPTVLVLDDQKAGAFDGSPLAGSVVRGDDPERAAQRVAALLGSGAPDLGVLRSRMERTSAVLATALVRARARSGGGA